MEQRYYIQYDHEGKVFAISEINCDLAKVNEYNPDLIGSTYDPDTGEFSGYRIILKADKQTVEVGQTVEITAIIVNWDRSPSDFSGDVLFKVGNAKQTVKATDGVAVLTYQGDAAGKVTVRVDGDAFMNHEFITIDIKETEQNNT